MSRYIGPKVKIIRRLGPLPGLSQKSSIKTYPPGQHGRQLKKPSQYAIRLMEKQKLRYNYGIGEKQLLKYLKKARKNSRSTSQVLLELLEMRLDNILYRMGVVKSIDEAKQKITHKHIQINNQIVSIPSYHCKINDQISFSKKSYDQFFENVKLQNLPSFIEIKKREKYAQIKSIISRYEIPLKINELLIIEYYSKR